MSGKQRRQLKSVESTNPLQDEYIPSNIVKDSDRKKVWDFLVADMKHRNCYSSTFTFAISEAAITAADLVKQMDSLDEEGAIIDRYNKEGEWVGTKENPRFNVVMRMKGHLMKLIEKLGLSPRDISFILSENHSGEAAADAHRTIEPKTQGIVYFSD